MDQTLQGTLKMQTALNVELEEKKEQHANMDFKMVAFSLGGKDYAIDILRVKEIAKADRFTYVPNTSPFVVGVYNLRGEIIPIIDLRIFFNVNVEKKENENTEAEFQNMIIIQIGDQKYGTIVDRIEKVAGIQSSEIQPPHPLFGDINIKYIYGIVEHASRMYILLDVARIFGIEANEDYEQKEMRLVSNTKQAPEVKSEPPRARMGEILSTIDISANTQKAVDVTPVAQTPVAAPPVVEPVKVQPTVVAPAPVIEKEPVVERPAPVVVEEPVVVQQAVQPSTGDMDEVEFKFVLETLKKHESFHTTHVNETWVKRRYLEWKKIKGEGAPLNDANDSKEFLRPFFSKLNGAFWTQEYADKIFAMLPDNQSKQISIWNPGCGAGYEAYSLACIFQKRYPDSKIKVYAHDTDLILISSAPVLSIPSDLENSWYAPYLSKTASGVTTFTPAIRDSILFEYHDCTNMNVVPVSDFIFSRDFLSYVSENKIDEVILDFYEKLKDTGLVVIGDNELLVDNTKWLEKMYDNIVSYNKM